MVNVEMLCKTQCKSLRILSAKLCIKNWFNFKLANNLCFPLRITHFSTAFPTIKYPLFTPMVFHFFTAPTTTTTKNINKIK